MRAQGGKQNWQIYGEQLGNEWDDWEHIKLPVISKGNVRKG